MPNVSNLTSCKNLQSDLSLQTVFHIPLQLEIQIFIKGYEITATDEIKGHATELVCFNFFTCCIIIEKITGWLRHKN